MVAGTHLLSIKLDYSKVTYAKKETFGAKDKARDTPDGRQEHAREKAESQTCKTGAG